MGRVLGAALRPGVRSGRDSGRPVRAALSHPPGELVEEIVEIGGRRLSLLRPRSADELIDETRFDEDEFLPYWAELWASGIALARALAARDLRDVRLLELGAGLGVPSLVAAAGGADVLATDWSADAVELLASNAARNALHVRTECARWDEPDRLLGGAPWPLVVGADLLYERRNADQLLVLLPRLTREVLLADPGRPFAKGFLERAAAAWDVTSVPDTETVSMALHRLRLR